jgi:hypothetical protein
MADSNDVDNELRRDDARTTSKPATRASDVGSGTLDPAAEAGMTALPNLLPGEKVGWRATSDELFRQPILLAAGERRSGGPRHCGGPGRFAPIAGSPPVEAPSPTTAWGESRSARLTPLL